MYDCQKLIVMQTGDEKTYESIKDLKGYEILFQKNNGYGNALIEGVEATKTEFFCIINADGSMNPAYLESMLSECNGRDFVFTSRYSRDGGSDDDDFVTFIGNKFFSLFGNILYQSAFVSVIEIVHSCFTMALILDVIAVFILSFFRLA